MIIFKIDDSISKQPYRPVSNKRPPFGCNQCDLSEECEDNVFKHNGLALCEAVFVVESEDDE